jgi:hypothetical protein
MTGRRWKLYGVWWTDAATRPLQEGRRHPTIATGDIAIRQVKESSPQIAQDRLIAHVRKQGFSPLRARDSA